MVFTIDCGPRGKEWAKTLHELTTKQAIINRNGTDFVTKFDMLQRFLITTIKYGVSLSNSENPESAIFILKYFDENSFYLLSTGEYKKLVNKNFTIKKRNIFTWFSRKQTFRTFFPEVNELLAGKKVIG